MDEAGHKLDVVNDFRTADDCQPRPGRQERGQVLGHIHAVIKIRVDQRRGDRKARALKREDRNPVLTGGLDRLGRLEGIKDIHNDTVHPGLNAAPNRPVLPGYPVRSAHIDRQRSQFNARLLQAVVKSVGQGVKPRMRPVFHHIHVEYTHLVLRFRARPIAACSPPALTRAASFRYCPG